MMINDSSGSWVIVIQNHRYQRCNDSILIFRLDCSNGEQPLQKAAISVSLLRWIMVVLGDTVVDLQF